MTLKEKIGQMLAIGFPPGEEGMARLRRVVRTTRAGNVILFSRNTPEAEATASVVAALRSEIESEVGIPPLVAIDQEGGIVARLRKGVSPIPGAMAQAAACLGGEVSVEAIEALGRLCGTELAALGVNWNLAPVADVNVNPGNPVIGVRSYGEDPRLVADLSSAFARGLRAGGVAATAKHFPGHGDTTVDSHLDIPLVPHDMERLESVELLPFKRLISERIAAVMTSHVRFPAAEPDLLPATLSPRVLEGLLRNTLGFKGIICSDCMEMKAISDHFPNPFVRAVKAGVDVLFISHTEERQVEAADSLYRAVLSGEIPESRIDASVGRILACKREYAGGGPQGALGNLPPREPGKDSLAVRVSRGSLTVLRKKGDLGPSALTAGGALIDVAPGNLTGAEDSGTPLSIAARLSGLRSAWSATRVSLDPSAEEIDAALAQASTSLGSKSSVSLALSLSAPLAHEGQVELLARCAKLAASKKVKFLVLLMRSPYDAPELARLCARASGVEATILAAYEYTELSAASVADYLAGEFEAKGVCPVTLPP